MLEAVREVLLASPDVLYALVFGSAARGQLGPASDLDVALEMREGAARDLHSLGRLIGRLEAAAGRRVDLVLLDEAAPPVAYRVFRDGRLVVTRDQQALVARKARAIVEYLDFQPIEERCTAGVLRAAARGR
jgi:predicted nucleotidyltransferase